MKRVLLRSVYDAFEYVMKHYYPAGMEELAELKDSYCVISVQDTHTGGFGFEFKKSRCCRDVLTLYFDDVEREVEGAALFSEKQADDVISFILSNKSADTLLVHCYAGESRSRAIAAFAVKMLGGDNSKYFATGHPNQYVYDALETAWIKRMMAQKEELS